VAIGYPIDLVVMMYVLLLRTMSYDAFWFLLQLFQAVVLRTRIHKKALLSLGGSAPNGHGEHSELKFCNSTSNRRVEIYE